MSSRGKLVSARIKRAQVARLYLRPSLMGELERGCVPRTWAQQQRPSSLVWSAQTRVRSGQRGWDSIRRSGNPAPTRRTCLLLRSPRAFTLELLSPGCLRWRSDRSQHPILYIYCTVPLSQIIGGCMASPCLLPTLCMPHTGRFACNRMHVVCTCIPVSRHLGTAPAYSSNSWQHYRY